MGKPLLKYRNNAKARADKSYRTVSVRYHDDSFEDIVKVEAQSDYVSTIRSFAEYKNTVHSRDATALANPFLDEVKRRLNRILGRPATPEIGVIANFLLKIKDEVRQKSGITIHDAVIATPNLFESDNVHRQQFQQDLDEASNNVGIKPVLSPSWISAFSAGATSQGWGICSSYTDVEKCEAEEGKLRLETALTVEYTRDALVVALVSFDTARSASDKLTRLSYNAGADHDTNEGHWNLVKKHILELPRQYRGRDITKILVTGDKSESPKLLEILREVIEGLVINRPDLGAVGKGYDPVIAVARGAAELAKRKQEAPRDCVEPPRCQEIRRKMKEEYRKGDEVKNSSVHQELR